MEWKEYMKLSANTCADLKTAEANNNHMLMGMVTEVGELVDAYKKHYAYGKVLDKVNVKEELGDLMFYISNFCRMNNINLEDQLTINIDKLKARYPHKFDSDKAINRDLDTERKILEGNSFETEASIAKLRSISKEKLDKLSDASGN